MKFEFFSASKTNDLLGELRRAGRRQDEHERLATSTTLAANGSPEGGKSSTLQDTRNGWVVAFLVFSVYALIWSHWIRSFFFPWGDDFAVMVDSLPVFHPHVRAWFFEGFGHYFQVYPDRTAKFSDFIRPGVNATFYAEWFLFHSHWAFYLLTTYAAIAAMAGLVYTTGRRFLGVSPGLALMAALAVGFAPSIDTNALWDPAFAFDLLAGVLVLAGVVFLLSGRYIPAWLVFTFACFTKETALFALPAAALVVWFRTGKGSQSLAFLAPLAAWGGLRWYDFHGAAGVYIIMGEHRHGPVREAIARAVTGIWDWPVATQVFRKPDLPLLRLVRLIGLIASIGFWVGLGFGLASLARRSAVRPRRWWVNLRSSEQMAFFTVLVFCAASLALPLALDVPRRFGASFFPLFVLSLIAVAQYASTLAARTWAAALVVCVGVSGAMLIVADLRYLQPQAVETWRTSHAYVDALHSSKQPVLLVVDDSSSVWSANAYVQRLAGYQGQLTRIDDLTWKGDCAVQPTATLTNNPDGSVQMVSEIPASCGSHGFVNMYPAVTSRTFSRSLKEAQLDYDLGLPSKSGVLTLTVTITPREDGIGVLLPDVLKGHAGEVEVDLAQGRSSTR